MYSPRGVIRNRSYSNQVKDFSGLRYGKITPTDIDGLLDFGDKLWVLIELKYGAATMPYGQRLAIERLIDIIWQSGRLAVALIASHADNGDIDVANAVVGEYRYMGSWVTPKNTFTVRAVIDYLIEDRLPHHG